MSVEQLNLNQIDQNGPSSDTLDINFKNDEIITIPTAPLCTGEQIHHAIDIVDEKFPELAALLPDGPEQVLRRRGLRVALRRASHQAGRPLPLGDRRPGGGRRG